MSFESPWDGPAIWVKVKERPEVGQVVGESIPIGVRKTGTDSEETVSAYAVRFDETGEIAYYDTERVFPCDMDGRDRQGDPVNP